jgi:hypothetical protein
MSANPKTQGAKLTKATVTPPDADAAEGLMKEFALAETKAEQAKAELAGVKKKLLALFPVDVAGDYEMVCGKWVTNVSVPTRVKWDGNEIAAYYGSDLPAHVERKLSIKDEAFNRLPTHEQTALRKAREEDAGTPRLKVEVVK